MGILATIIIVTTGVAFAALALLRRYADGPFGPFPGGPLRAGELERVAPADWSFAKDARLAELQLVDPTASRITGVLVHEGGLYVPCDLGFIWRRAPAPGRWGMAIAWALKRWHEHAARDGRVILRLRGRRYELQAERVIDPAVEAALGQRVVAKAEEFLSAPLPKEVPADGEIWFFQLVARPERAKVEA